MHAVVTLGEPEHLAPPLLSSNPVVSLMSPEPPRRRRADRAGSPDVRHGELLGGRRRPAVDVHVPDGPSRDGQPPVIQIWARPRDMAPDILFALMCGDVSMPVAFAVGRRGWAPTVQLTAYLRGLPADGWLRVMATTTQIGQDWFDEDHLVVDSHRPAHRADPPVGAGARSLRASGMLLPCPESRSSAAETSARRCCQGCCARAARSRTSWSPNASRSAGGTCPRSTRCWSPASPTRSRTRTSSSSRSSRPTSRR